MSYSKGYFRNITFKGLIHYKHTAVETKRCPYCKASNAIFFEKRLLDSQLVVTCKGCSNKFIVKLGKKLEVNRNE